MSPVQSECTDDDGSIEQIHAREYYKHKETWKEDPSLEVPYPLLCGESVEYLGRMADGIIALSNYRLFLKYKHTFVNVPKRLIDNVEYRDIFYIYINCKDARCFRCIFPTNESCVDWHRHFLSSLQPVGKVEELFAFAYHAWCRDKSTSLSSLMSNTYDVSTSIQDGLNGEEQVEPAILTHNPREALSYRSHFYREFSRLGFDAGMARRVWRVTKLNESYQMCSTYPRYHITPADVTDSELEKVASFRAFRRIPSVVWRHRENGSVLARSSQPEVSWWGWRSAEDEKLLRLITESCARDGGQMMRDEASASTTTITGVDPDHHTRQDTNHLMGDGEDEVCTNGEVDEGDLTTTPNEVDTSNHEDVDEILAEPETSNMSSSAQQTTSRKLLILDARSYPAAVANRAKGGGCECEEYYSNSEIQFMSLANIHSIRASLHKLRSLSPHSDPSTWYSSLEGSRWLMHVSGLMRAAVTAVHALHNDARPVLVHCSDGWDRTPQIVALTEVILDSYYRTIDGFQVLCEREWLDFGHKFSDRCGQVSDDINERCPVFLQWLDCIHQLQIQSPTAFEFNEAYLLKLVQHSYACLFGSFLCNSQQERELHRISHRTFSVWTFLSRYRHDFRNLLYSPTKHILKPSYHCRDLRFWSSVYCCDISGSNDLYPEQHLLSLAEDSTSSAAGTASGPPSSSSSLQQVVKTRSCDDLTKADDGDAIGMVNTAINATTSSPLKRTSSDPSLNKTSFNPPIQTNIETSSQQPHIIDTTLVKDDVVAGVDLTDESMEAIKLDEIPTSDNPFVIPSVRGSRGRAIALSLACNISTSTSELTDSHLGPGITNNTATNSSSGFSSSQSSPQPSCPTPHSSDPTTPTMTTHTSSALVCDVSDKHSLVRRIDVDGLTIFRDPVHSRMEQIEVKHELEVERLRQEISRLRLQLLHSTNNVVSENGTSHMDDRSSQAESVGSGGEAAASVGGASTAPSDVSWEHVEERDTTIPVLWVPDHAVASCQSCGTDFCIIKRKHHCRNCGKVYCGDCSSFFMKLPEEQLYEPVRVCQTCCQQLKLRLDSDTPPTSAVSNGVANGTSHVGHSD